MIEECSYSDSDAESAHHLKYTSGRPKPSGSKLSQYDVLAVAVRCPHGKMPLASVRSSDSFSPSSTASGLWLPYISLNKDCHKLGAKNGLALLGEFLLEEAQVPTSGGGARASPPPPFEKASLHLVTRIQLPNGRFISRLIYIARWSADVTCCDGQQNNNDSNLTWASVSSLRSKPSFSCTAANQALVSHLWGSEVTNYAEILNSADKMNCFLDSFGKGTRTLLHLLSELTLDEQVLKYVQRKPSLSPVPGANWVEATSGGSGCSTDLGTDNVQPSPPPPPTTITQRFMELVASAQFSDSVVLKLYSDFVQHCYPATSMTVASYRAFMAAIKLDVYLGEDKLIGLFNASNYKAKGFLSFNELLLGLVSLDPNSTDCQARHVFIFRYYNSAGDGTLSQADISRLLSDPRPYAEWKPTGDTRVPTLNIDQFLKEIESGRMTGTNLLCRSKRSILKMIKESEPVYEVISSLAVRSGTFAVNQMAANCTRHRPKTYSLAMHSPELISACRLINPKVVPFSTPSAIEVLDQQICSPGNSLPSSTLATIKRQHSREVIFNPTSVAGYVLKIVRRLRDFNRLTDEQKAAVRQEVNQALTVGLVNALCEQVSEVLAAESRVLQVSTPTFVMGDIHGNINDLLTFERQLWPGAPAAQTANVLFLGDYVDRGEFGVEVVCYLFAMKLLTPTRFFLLRGNHEIRQIQRNFTFEKECLDKYGTGGAGLAVFEKFNSAFDQLPFSAVVDESIFCAHGGIPFSVLTIDGLNQLPCGVAEPEKEAAAIWEILWSDPITNPEYQQLADFMNKKDDSGYLSNMKRSTAFYFSELATNAFLRKNGLSRVIRAHEVINEGYKLNHRGTVITIFSCSRYCGAPNKAAAILVEGHSTQGFLKIIALDT